MEVRHQLPTTVHECHASRQDPLSGLAQARMPLHQRWHGVQALERGGRATSRAHAYATIRAHH